MSPDNFREYLKHQKQQKNQAEAINWEEKKLRWQEAAKGFVDQVKEFLAEFSEDIRFEDKKIQLNEDNIGSYEAAALSVILPSQRVELIPAGMHVIGADGRFDMEGIAGKVKWVLVPKTLEKPQISVQIKSSDEPMQSSPAEINDNMVWKLATPPPNIRFIPLSKETLLEAIMEVTNG